MLKLALFTDIHYIIDSNSGKRKAHMGRILLRKAILRINLEIQPDLTIVLGDLIDDDASPQAEAQLTELARDLGKLDSGLIVLPGNHDPAPDVFYRILPQLPDPWLDIKDCRIIPFLDAEAPEWNAVRSADDLRRMRLARKGFDGTIIALQHVPLSPPELELCRFNLTNAADVIEIMRGNNIQLVLGGHEHDGFDHEQDGIRYFCAGALCEAPFRYYEIEIDAGRTEIREHQIQWPASLQLMDLHSHTEFAYCSQDMELALTPLIAREIGLDGVAITEHSGQLYFSRDDFWSAEYIHRGIKGAASKHNRRDEYLRQARQLRADDVCIGLEVDCDAHGDPVMRPNDREDFDVLLGALHYMPIHEIRNQDPEKVYDLFLAQMERFTACGIDVLAHPFRLLSVNGLPIPERVWRALLELLRINHVATELNFHHIAPQSEYVRACIDAGVKITLGSDAHQIHKIGELGPHLRLLQELGYDGELKDILFDPRKNK
ncbi:metallophosphoesterase [Candidatus Sumerlaeota bacterium]|nr:metallophosphoesterase [Candidatus Sumerlaeota bacterium]